MTDPAHPHRSAEDIPPDDTNRIPALWFDSRGFGPDEFAFELQPFSSDLDGAIPASLGLRIRPAVGGIVIAGHALLDGGFNLHREQVEELYRQLGLWLEGNPEPTEEPTTKPDETRRFWTVLVILRGRRGGGDVPGIGVPVRRGRFTSKQQATEAAALWRSDPWFLFDAEPSRGLPPIFERDGALP